MKYHRLKRLREISKTAKILPYLNIKIESQVQKRNLTRKMKMIVGLRSDSEYLEQTSPGTLSKLVLDSPKILQSLHRHPSKAQRNFPSEVGGKAFFSSSHPHSAPSTRIRIPSLFPAKCSLAPHSPVFHLAEVEAQLAQEEASL